MTNELVERRRDLSDPQSDWGDLAPTRDRLITCRVGQPTSRKKGTQIGKFNYSNEWEPSDKIEGATVVLAHRTRVLYGKTFESPRRCGSDNYHQPSSFIKDPIWDRCADCIASKWPDGLTPVGIQERNKLIAELDAKNTGGPLCSDTINLVLVDSRKIPFVITAQKTQISKVKNELINKLSWSGKRKYQLKFDVTLVEKTTNKGKWYEYEFSNFRDVDNEQELLGFVKLFEMSGETALANEHNAMDMEKEVGEVPF